VLQKLVEVRKLLEKGTDYAATPKILAAHLHIELGYNVYLEKLC